MPDLQDGESVAMQGSGARPYVLKNVGGVYSCTCPAWRNQSIGIERRTCKHLRKLRGDAAEEARIGSTLPTKPIEAADGASGMEPAFSHAKAICFMLPIGLSPVCPRSRLTANYGWDGRDSSEPSASCAGRTRTTCGRRSATLSSTLPLWRRALRNVWRSSTTAYASTSQITPRRMLTLSAKVSITCARSWLAWKRSAGKA